MFKAKKKYEQKLNRQLTLHKEFLIENLKKEWDEIQKTAKREQLVRQAKAGAGVMAEILLGLLVVAGVLTVAAVAPNIFVAFNRTTGRRSFFEKKNFNRAKRYLLRQNYARLKFEKDGLEIAITSDGLNKALQKSFQNLKLDKSKPWDRFWRIVIFDIPDRHKWARDGLRKKLKSLGFYQLQESVFIAPYDCEKEIDFLVSIFNIRPYVYLIKTQHLSDDAKLKNIFVLH